MVKFGMMLRNWDSLHHAKFCKNRLRGYTPFGQIYTKKPLLAILGAVGPHFKTHSGEIWHEGVKQ